MQLHPVCLYGHLVYAKVRQLHKGAHASLQDAPEQRVMSH